MTRVKKNIRWYILAPVFIVAGVSLSAYEAVPQTRQQHGVPTEDVQSCFLEWPLPSGADQYADIDDRPAE